MESVYYWYDQEKLNSDCLADLYIFNVPYSTVKVEWDGGGGRESQDYWLKRRSHEILTSICVKSNKVYTNIAEG